MEHNYWSYGVIALDSEFEPPEKGGIIDWPSELETHFNLEQLNVHNAFAERNFSAYNDVFTGASNSSGNYQSTWWDFAEPKISNHLSEIHNKLKKCIAFDVWIAPVALIGEEKRLRRGQLPVRGQIVVKNLPAYVCHQSESENKQTPINQRNNRAS